MLPLSEREKVVHLLNRAGFGPRPGDVDRVLKIGIARYVEEQLHPQRIDDSAIDRWNSSFDVLGGDPKDARRVYKDKQPERILNQLTAYKVMRAVESRRQMHELLVDFWFNHFNVYWWKDDLKYLTMAFEQDAIRPRTLGKFPDLLLATAKHPAMLYYLDNALSSSPNSPPRPPLELSGINENYARELMELHTMGVDGGYTQRDVEEVARCFTGWTVDAETLAFRYDEVMHDAGEKTVLGHSIPHEGYAEGERVLRILIGHPSTARFIATKLVRRFVSDNPPGSLVGRVADVFTRTGGDIREMCRTILTSEEFFDPAVYRTKVKMPLDLVVSSVRALNAEVLVPRNDAFADFVRVLNAPDEKTMQMLNQQRSIAYDADRRRKEMLQGLPADVHAYVSLAAAMERMGQYVYAVFEPTGDPEDKDFWINSITLVQRLGFALSLAENQILGMEFAAAQIKKLTAGVRGPLTWQAALDLILGSPGRMVHPADAPQPKEAAQCFGIALGTPEFQHK
jgi:uncharacterized protein (DUF1800 family)